MQNRVGSMAMLLEAERASLDKCYRLVLLGSCRVGKTSIVTRFLGRGVNDEPTVGSASGHDDRYTPTIDDYHRKVYFIDGLVYRLDIVDTSGLCPFPAMRRVSLLIGDLFLLVYSIDSRDSFDEVKRLIEELVQLKGPKNKKYLPRKDVPPLIIIGNKCDRHSDRQVSLKDLKEAAQGRDYIEASARENINMETVFLRLFVSARIPPQMCPSLHREVHPYYIMSREKSSENSHVTANCGSVIPNVKRPSVHSELMLLQSKKTSDVIRCPRTSPIRCHII